MEGDKIDLGEKSKKIKVKNRSIEELEFKESRKAEIDGFVKDGTFHPVEESKFKLNTRIFGSRFIDELNKVGYNLHKRSRLIERNYED